MRHMLLKRQLLVAYLRLKRNIRVHEECIFRCISSHMLLKRHFLEAYLEV